MPDLEQTIIVLKEFPNFDFSTKTDRGRKRLQKFIYLLEVFGAKLGYEYQTSASGPFSSALNENMDELSELYNTDKKLRNQPISDNGEGLDSFRRWIKDRESDSDFLQIASSLHYLRSSAYDKHSQLYDKHGLQYCTTDEIIRKVTNQRDGFTEEQTCSVFKELRCWNDVHMIFGVTDGGRYIDEDSEICEKYENGSTSQ